MIPNLILLIFQFFFLLEKRERVTGFWLRERNFLLLKNLVTKMIIFLCLMVKVKIICFFNLKTPKKSYMSSEIFFFVLDGFWILRQFFMLFMAMNWFNKVSWVFLTCFRPKIGFWVKKQRILFFLPILIVPDLILL